MKRSPLPALLLCACLLPFNASAQAQPDILTEQSQDGVTYIDGGIGEAERDEIRRRAPEFNLVLLLTERDGSYLAGAEVLVLDGKQQIRFTDDNAGPFLLLRLPPGRYEIRASVAGERQSSRVTIGPRGQQQRVLRW